MKTITKEFEEAALKAVMFWSDKAFRTKLNQNNGDGSVQGGAMFVLMNRMANIAQAEITSEMIKKFEDRLLDVLIETKTESPNGRITLSVDYHPCALLHEAIKYAGIDAACFPCKTFTVIEVDNTVIAKYQYGTSSFNL